MPKADKNPRLAIISLTCCEGCQFAILDLGEKMVELFKNFVVVEFSLVQDEKNNKEYDFVLVEGTPITKENFKKLELARKSAKTLIALGSCAHLGGFQQLKNYVDKEEKIKYVYQFPKGLDNPEIKPLSYFVKVDYVIHGCPITGGEFLRIMMELRNGITPKIPDRTVCYECQIKGNPCLLQQGKPCFGPVILGGCEAVCPSHGFPCYACRGPVSEPNLESLKQIFKEHGLEDKFEILMQEFGAADEVLSIEKK